MKINTKEFSFTFFKQATSVAASVSVLIVSLMWYNVFTTWSSKYIKNDEGRFKEVIIFLILISFLFILLNTILTLLRRRNGIYDTNNKDVDFDLNEELEN